MFIFTPIEGLISSLSSFSTPSPQPPFPCLGEGGLTDSFLFLAPPLRQGGGLGGGSIKKVEAARIAYSSRSHQAHSLRRILFPLSISPPSPRQGKGGWGDRGEIKRWRRRELPTPVVRIRLTPCAGPLHSLEKASGLFHFALSMPQGIDSANRSFTSIPALIKKTRVFQPLFFLLVEAARIEPASANTLLLGTPCSAFALKKFESFQRLNPSNFLISKISIKRPDNQRSI